MGFVEVAPLSAGGLFVVSKRFKTPKCIYYVWRNRLLWEKLRESK